MDERRQVDRRIESLNAAAQPVCREWLAKCEQRLALRYPGSEVRITETRRSRLRQAALAANPDRTSVKLGWHNVGLAWDFMIFDRTLDGRWVMAKNGEDIRYEECGKIAAALGCKYPIILANGKPDYCHVEYHPGFTLSQFIAKYPEEGKA